MAIPKVCGIENEFGFIVLSEDGEQIMDKEYDEICYYFVNDFLKLAKAVSYDMSQESRSPGDWQLILERLHSLKIFQLLMGLMEEAPNGFLENGARFYLDAEHPEYSTPECLLPLDLVAYDKASELVMKDGLKLFAGRPMAENRRLIVHKNNSDGYGNSYGCHLNVLLNSKMFFSADKFKYLVRHYMPFQIARMVLIGGGKLGAENGRPACVFQLSQRADFFKQLIGLQTVVDRPIFNTRNEPHADRKRFFRLHDISADSLMCEQAIFLKAALSQIVLAMIEDRFLKDNLMPKNPIGAMIAVSRDLEFKTRIELESGKKMTGLEILRQYLLKAKEYLVRCPMSQQHNDAVNQALDLLEQLEKDFRPAFGKLDWATARGLMESRPDSARRNLLAFREVSDRGLYYELAKRGKISRLTDDETIQKAKSAPPFNTRAYARSELIRKFGSRISRMSWGQLNVKIGDSERVVALDNPALDKIGADMLISSLGL